MKDGLYVFQTLLRLLVQYYGSLAIQDPPALSLLDKLTRQIYELTQSSPAIAAQILQRILQRQQADFIQMRSKKRPVIVTLDTVNSLLLSVFIEMDLSKPLS